MGIATELATGPDTFGLHEYFITDVYTEISGSNVRMICGVRRGGAVHWLYSCVMPAELLINGSKQCRAAAEEAFTLMQMMDRRASH